MSPAEVRPPALSRRVLAWASRRLGVAELADDAGDLFEERARRHGERAARAWYRRQALASLRRVVLPSADDVREAHASTLDAVSRSGARSLRTASPWASRLDVKLAARMLTRHPGLTVVAVFALAIGIPVGLLPLHVLSSLTRPLPVQDAERVVIVRNYDRAESSPVERPLHDFVRWRAELSSFEDLGIWRSDLYNVAARDGRTTPLSGAEVSASVLALLRVPPLMGRPLLPSDEVEGAENVVVVAHDVWQSRLAGAPDVVGSTIRVGGVPHTVVGVMPEGFLFPVREHLWLPFRYDPLAFERGEGPSAWVMGRLKPGVTAEEAQREIAFVGERMAKESPGTHADLQPQVMPYTRTLTGMDAPETKSIVLLAQVLAFLLLALACGNVGVLVLARAATRSVEIAVRTALGASRARILSQLFVESLVLALLGAGVGLVVLQAVATGPEYLTSGLPFWVDFEVSLETALLAMGLAVLSAVIAGVVPAMKATGRDVRASMQGLTAGGSGIRFGRGYSAMIVGEVAAALFLLAIGSTLLPTAMSEPASVGIPADQYLHASVRIPRVEESSMAEPTRRQVSARAALLHRELARVLAEEPGLGSVAIASVLPGMSHPLRYIEVEGVPREPGAPAPAYQVNVARVDPGYFAALEQPIVGGRAFGAGDLTGDRSAVIVNTSFVDRVLAGRNPIGRRIRYWSPGREPGPWSHEIVGVVGPLGMNPLNAAADEGIYHPVAPGELHPVSLAVRVGSDPARFTPRLRAIVASIDPGALVHDAIALADVPDANRRVLELGTWLVAALAIIAVVLAASCLYALMSFTVAERTRETAIRAALGAPRSSIVRGIARRALVQLSLGVAIGSALSALVLSLVASHDGGTFQAERWPLVVGGLALLMVVVGMLACVRPTLRVLRIQPQEALKG